MGDSYTVGEPTRKDEELPMTLPVLLYLLNDTRTVPALSPLFDPLASVLAELLDCRPSAIMGHI